MKSAGAKPVLLFIEFSYMQIETLEAQILVAQDDFEVHVMAPASVEKDLSSTLKVRGFHPIPRFKEKPKWKILWQAYKIFKSLKPPFVVFNDCQGNSVKWFCLMLLTARSRFVGLHQNPQNLIKSFTQSIINLRVKDYLVLGDYILSNIKDKAKKGLKLQSFYAVFSDRPLSKKEWPIHSELKIAIHGFVEVDRRDYFGFLKALKTSRTKLSPLVKFMILGNSNSPDGQRFKKGVQEAGLESHFVFYNQFIPQDELIRQTSECDLVMTLIHPNDPWFFHYKNYKISGAYLWSGAFRRPLLLHDVFKSDPEFEGWGLFYSEETLVEDLNRLAGDKSVVIKKAQEMTEQDRFKLEEQKKRFRSFVLGSL